MESRYPLKDKHLSLTGKLDLKLRRKTVRCQKIIRNGDVGVHAVVRSVNSNPSGHSFIFKKVRLSSRNREEHFIEEYQ